jgi:clan AA aspartic protease
LITGIVNADLEAKIRLSLRGPAGQIRRVRAIIDTGYDGWLTLPSSLIAELGLIWQRQGRALLADGSESIFDIFAGDVFWDRRRRRIPVDEASTIPLVGRALLAGYGLKAEFRWRGKVTIKPLKRRRG